MKISELKCRAKQALSRAKLAKKVKPPLEDKIRRQKGT